MSFSLKVAAVIFAVSSANAYAQSSNHTSSGLYAGINFSSTKIDELGTKGGFGGYLGYKFTQNFAAELGLSNNGKYDYFGTSVKVTAANLSLVGSIPVSSNVDLFGRLGYGNLKAKVSAGTFSESGNDNSALFGAGVRLNLNPQYAIRAEFARLSSDSTTFSLGAQFNF
jgi:OmpA-OmpF porin, OOP family